MGNRPKFLKRPTGNLTGLSMMVGCYALSGKLGAGMRTVVVVALWCEQVADLPMRMVGENRRAWWGIFMRILTKGISPFIDYCVHCNAPLSKKAVMKQYNKKS